MDPERSWRYRGQVRPPFADVPGPAQVSVWDYPRPPALVFDVRAVVVRADGDAVVARSTACVRVCETASPPTFYVPPEDVSWERLVQVGGASTCEWKGVARYWALAAAPADGAVGWSYSDPLAGFTALRDYVGFYPARLVCTVDGERARPQPGAFYGGWVTDDLAGPFKGEPGTERW